MWLIKAYKRLHPRYEINIRYVDGIEYIEKNRITLKKEIHDLISEGIINEAESYNQIDARELGICFRMNAVNYPRICSVNLNWRYYICLFVGVQTHGDGRNKKFQAIRWNLQRAFTKGVSRWLFEHLVEYEDLKNDLISYDEYTKLVGMSEVVVDLYRISPLEGLSFRTAEAMCLRKKVITDRVIIKEFDFYDPSRFFILGLDPWSKFRDFICQDFKPLGKEYLNQLNCETWWKNDLS